MSRVIYGYAPLIGLGTVSYDSAAAGICHEEPDARRYAEGESTRTSLAVIIYSFTAGNRAGTAVALGGYQGGRELTQDEVRTLLSAGYPRP